MALSRTLIVIGVILGTYGPGWTRGGEYVLVSLGSHGAAIKPFDISVTSRSVNLTSASVTTSWNLTSSQNTTVSVTQGHLFSYGMDRVLQGISTRGDAVHIQTSDEIDVSVISCFSHSGGAYRALPVESLGQVCFIITPDDCSNNCHIAIAATEDNTTVTLTPGDIIPNWEHVPGLTLSNDTFTFQLDKHESIKLGSVSDLSGTHVESDKPVAVFSGSTGSRGDRGFDTVIEQLPSSDQWGRTFYTIPTPYHVSKQNFYKFIASHANTTVSVGGQVTDLLDAGSFATVTLSSDAFVEVTSSKPLMMIKMVQRDAGLDGCMSLVLSLNQYISGTSFFLHNGYNNYVSIIINVTHKDDILLDQSPLPGTANWTLSDNLDMALGVVLVSNGSHTLTVAAPGVRFAAYLHGVSINTNATVCLPLGVALSVSRWPSPMDTCTCSTVCFDEDTVNRTITAELIANLTEEIRKNLTVEREQLSASVRKRKAASDNRPSSQGMGTIGVVFITVLMAVVVLFDITGMFLGPTYAFSKKIRRSKLRQKTKKKDEDIILVSKLQTITSHE